MNISFHGAVETVTGSNHLLKFNDKKILLDCGQFQGSNREELMNWEKLPYDPSDIDYILLSHSHIDHCGRIPLMVKRGFRGQIICTKATHDLCEIMLLDSAHIHEMEAEWENRKAKRANKRKTTPLYTQEDARNSMKFFKTVLYNQVIKLDEDLIVKYNDAGHILGSAIIEIWIKENGNKEPIKIVFSGDLGTFDRPILKDPTSIDSADYLIMESTYGSRLHKEKETHMDRLIDIIIKTVNRGGNVVIPSFAVGRTQEIIYGLNEYYEGNGEKSEFLKKIPVYIDSPLATRATEVFKRNAQVFDMETREKLLNGDNPLHFKNLHFTLSAAESKAINSDKSSKIIISASGMCDAGRIKHHLKHNLWREESSIVFVGYQADNTLGRRIRDGAKLVKLFGEEIAVNADIYSVEGFSGHADQKGLLDWIKKFKQKPKKIFIVHGEDESKKEFARQIKLQCNTETIIPTKNFEYNLTKDEKISGYDLVTDRFEEAHEKADPEKVNKLEEQMIKLKDLFEGSVNLTDDYMNAGVNVEEYNELKNHLLEIEEKILNLTSITGK